MLASVTPGGGQGANADELWLVPRNGRSGDTDLSKLWSRRSRAPSGLLVRAVSQRGRGDDGDRRHGRSDVTTFVPVDEPSNGLRGERVEPDGPKPGKQRYTLELTMRQVGPDGVREVAFWGSVPFDAHDDKAALLQGAIAMSDVLRRRASEIPDD